MTSIGGYQAGSAPSVEFVKTTAVPKLRDGSEPESETSVRKSFPQSWMFESFFDWQG